MPDIVTIKITGLSELEEKLERLPIRVSRRILRTGLLAAAFVWVRAIEALAQAHEAWHHGKGKGAATLFGLLAKNIVTRVTVKSDLEGSVAVGPAKGIFWTKFDEFGTSKMRALPVYPRGVRIAQAGRARRVCDRDEGRTRARRNEVVLALSCHHAA